MHSFLSMLVPLSVPGSLSVFYVLCRSATVYLIRAYRTNRELLTQCCKSTLQSVCKVHDTLMLNRGGQVSTQGKVSEGKYFLFVLLAQSISGLCVHMADITTSAYCGVLHMMMYCPSTHKVPPKIQQPQTAITPLLSPSKDNLN